MSSLLPVLGLSLASGAISLGYQVMWFRLFAHRFGSTNLTFLLVLTTFIGGIGAGAFASRKLSDALGRRPGLGNPVVLVGALEILVSISALATLLLDLSGAFSGGGFPYLRDARGIYEPTLGLRLETGLAAAGMLVPTFLMGTTFPILCSAFRERAVFPSELYAWNTLGACSGVLLAEFVLLAHLGHTQAFQLLVVCNLGIGAAFVLAGRTLFADAESRARAALTGPTSRAARRRRARSVSNDAPHAAERPSSAGETYSATVLLVIAGLSGFVSGALEVDMFRAVRFAGAITDSAMSFTSFWAIVAIFAASTTVRFLRRPRPALLRFAVPVALGVYACTWLMLHEIRAGFNDVFVGWITSTVQASPDLPVANSVYPLSGSLAILLGFTGVVVFPAYYMVSLLLPAVCNLVQAERRHLGLAYGLNTAAFCVGAVAFTWVAPAVSLFYAVKLLFVVLAAAGVFAALLRPGEPVPRPAAAAAVLVVVAAVFVVPGGFDRRFYPSYEDPARYPVRAMKSNGSTTTFVVSRPDGDVLFFNSHEMSGTSIGAQRYMRLMAHVPLLAQANPRRALLVCFGVGNTARAIASHRTIEAIDIVDLNDKVFETAVEFEAVNGGVYRDPRVRLVHDDGRRFLSRTSGTYDLITSEPPPPRAEGVYRLYSTEYYASVLEHLTPEGMMTQWLPVNLLSRTAIDRMVASFVRVFPHALLFVGSEDQLILLGSRQPIDGRTIERRFESAPGARADLAAVGLSDPLHLFARMIRADAGLRQDVRGVPVVSDERNDLALLVTDPFDPPRIPFDPRGVIQSFSGQGLAVEERWRAVAGDPERLLSVVPDFPLD